MIFCVNQRQLAPVRRTTLGWLWALTACAGASPNAAPARPAPAAAQPPAAEALSEASGYTPPPPCDPHSLLRLETYLPSATPGMKLFVTSVRAPGHRWGAVLFTHGAGSAGSAVWDLDYRDYSVMRALACAGFDAYTVDVRGFGGSTPPAAMVEGQPDAGPPVVRAAEVMPDVQRALAYAKAQSQVKRVDLIGWSWGCVVAGMYAGLHPGDVRRLILYAPVFDKKNPRRHRTQGAWYPVERGDFFKYHDPDREDLGALKAHVRELFRFTEGDTLRLPSGPYRDIYGEDAPVWDPAKICARTMVLRGSEDRASTRRAALSLFDALAKAERRRFVELSGAGHFAFRTLAARRFRSLLLDFLRLPGEDGGCAPGGQP